MNKSSRVLRRPDGTLNPIRVRGLTRKILIGNTSVKPVEYPQATHGKCHVFLPPKGKNSNARDVPLVYDGKVPPNLAPLKRKWMKYAKVESLAYGPKSKPWIRRKCHAFFLNVALFWGLYPAKTIKWFKRMRRTSSYSTRIHCMVRIVRSSSVVEGLMSGDIDTAQTIDPIGSIDKFATLYRKLHPSESFKDPQAYSIRSMDD